MSSQGDIVIVRVVPTSIHLNFHDLGCIGFVIESTSTATVLPPSGIFLSKSL